MKKPLPPSDAEVEQMLAEYGDLLYKTCFVLVGNAADAQDAVQETFLKYLESLPTFREREHQKAWLIRVAVNCAKDRLRARKRCFSVADCPVQTANDPEQIEVLDAVLRLPEKERIVLFLKVVEGYSGEEIATILKISHAAVRKRLQYARDRLKLELE